MNLNVVILAAGMGTRLGFNHPKCLTVLKTGETIMARQIRNIRETFGENTPITIVVGYKLELITETFPDVNYVYNEAYDMTNTSKSLLRALKSTPKEKNVLWMNGDVVFDDDLLVYLKNHIESTKASTITVNSSSVADEEVKYTLGSEGTITSLSKQVPLEEALGESVGINYVTAEARPSLQRYLNLVDDNDYFERGIELSVQKDKQAYLPLDITALGLMATEVDFKEDLKKANESLVTV